LSDLQFQFVLYRHRVDMGDLCSGAGHATLGNIYCIGSEGWVIGSER